MGPDELLSLRRQARREKQQLDQRRLESHREIVNALFRGDQESLQIRSEALGQIEKWEKNWLCSPRYSHTWREWFGMPEKFARAAILREDDLGISMRQNSPFCHAAARIANAADPAPHSKSDKDL